MRRFNLVLPLYVLLVIITLGAAYAAPMNADQARQLAEGWIERSPVFQSADQGNPDFAVRSIAPLPLPSLSETAWHVALEPHGYIVISADDRVMPVICFSAAGDLHLDESPRNALRSMLHRDLTASFELLAQLDDPDLPPPDLSPEVQQALTANQELWHALLTDPGFPIVYDAPGEVLVPAMVQTLWNQTRHYNYLCPAAPSPLGGYDGKAPAGCVAIAASEVMKYHEWPYIGRWSHTYTDTGGDITGTHTRNFGAAPYDWPNMKASYSPWIAEPQIQVDAVSKLIYDAGVATEMNYTSSGSGAFSYRMRTSMAEFFFYEVGQRIRRTDGAEAFDLALRNQMLAGRPSMVSVPGHAIVADGLSVESGDDYFHISYGWGGSNDGWYRPSNIVGDSLQEGQLDVQPLFMPQITALPETSDTGAYSIQWTFPATRSSQVANFRLREGVLIPGPFSDSCADFSNWFEHTGWTIAADGHSGNGFRFESGTVGSYSLSTLAPIKLGTTSTLSFKYKTVLFDDRFLCDVSTDNGATWTNVLTVGNGTDTSWKTANISLADYAGAELHIRFRYQFFSGSYYPNWGVWLDSIEVSNAETIEWTNVDSAIAPATTSYALSGRASGTYYYSLQAHDGVSWRQMSPPAKIEVTAQTAQWNLTIASAHGTPVPAVGVHTYDDGTSVSASMPGSPITQGTTQHVCTGWAGTGSAPASGSTTNSGAFSIAQHSSVTWNWTNRYHLTLGTTGNGTLDRVSDWHTHGQTVTITATAGADATFSSWTGHTNGCTISGNQITVPMTSARSINALFAGSGGDFSFQAVALTNSVLLRWSPPAASGMPSDLVQLRFATDTYPADSSSGTAIYQGTNYVFEHTGLDSGQTYYYSIYVTMDDGETFIEPPP